MFCTLSYDALHLFEVLLEHLRRFPTYRADMVLYICEKFHENISNGFQLTMRTQVQMLEMVRFTVQRAINPKVCKPGLWFISSARCLIKFKICV